SQSPQASRPVAAATFHLVRFLSLARCALGATCQFRPCSPGWRRSDQKRRPVGPRRQAKSSPARHAPALGLRAGSVDTPIVADRRRSQPCFSTLCSNARDGTPRAARKVSCAETTLHRGIRGRGQSLYLAWRPSKIGPCPATSSRTSSTTPARE